MVATICAAIPLIPFTGGTSLIPSAIGWSAAAAGSATAAGGAGISVLLYLFVAIGGTLLISLFTDWEEVGVSAGPVKLTLKRKKK